MDQVFAFLDKQRDLVIDLQKHLVAIPALGPDNDGDGEQAKAEWLKGRMQDMGFPRLENIDAPDTRVSAGFRPNIAGIIPGKDTSRTLWVIAHTDVVPSGDLELWDSDPWTLRVEDDVMYGRGVEDNHQGIVSGLLVAQALLDLNITPPINYGALMVADEETASLYGLDYVVAHRADLFSKDDIIVVPDFGVADSSLVEIAEKQMLWLKVSVKGKQCHASTPGQGVNSLVAASAFVVKLRELYAKFNQQDELFDPPTSTFEPTKKEANVPNVNTIPGLDVFYVDCRVLADYDLDAVLAEVKAMGEAIETEYNVRVEYDIVQRGEAAPNTAPDSEVVTRLAKGIKAVYNVEAKPAGVGGGTVAAFLRKRGYPTAVWATCVHNAHQPNESSLISTQIGDAKVLAHMLLAE
ncbi:MAG: M20 family metallo-hydrolase [Desulfovibrio sp.]|nr:MAG: M20 family metallo-hydrolase [Desulfovibrio sp.]